VAIVIGGGSGNAISINSSVGSAGQVIVSDGTNSSWGSVSGDGFVAGTKLMFAQDIAPTGWTRVTDDSANNRMLRVVSGGGDVGGAFAGSASPILNNVVPAHTHSFTTGNQSVDHSHTGNTNNESNDHAHIYSASNNNNTTRDVLGLNAAVNSGVFNAGTSGVTANHFHSFGTGGQSVSHSHSGTTDNGSSATNWAPRYINMILCSKN
jgi:hypothetical protein